MMNDDDIIDLAAMDSPDEGLQDAGDILVKEASDVDEFDETPEEAYEELDEFLAENRAMELSALDFEQIRMEECREAVNDVVTPEVCDSWVEMSLDERKEVMEDLARAIAEAQGTEFNGVAFDAGDNDGPFETTFGYAQGDGIIHLNESVLADPGQFLKMVDTVAHESRHQFQIQAIADPEGFGISQEQADAWKYGFETYTNEWASAYDLVGYAYNPTESDARIFGETLAQQVVQNWKKDEMAA